MRFFAIFNMLIISLIGLLIDSAAGAHFMDDRQRGYFYFEKRVVRLGKELPNPKNNHASTAAAQLQEFRSKLEEAKAAMVMMPSVENTIKYLAIQREIFLKAEEVGKNWQLALLATPELNIARDQPIAGALVRRRDEKLSQENAIKAAAGEFNLLFFFKSSCIYCRYFSKILSNFSQKYGFAVAAITLDNSDLPEFPGQRRYNLVQKLNVKYTPSLFLFKDNIAIPVTHGFVSADILERNMHFVLNHLRGEK